MNLALIGCGRMGRGHAQTAHDLGFPVVAFCDILSDVEIAPRRTRTQIMQWYPNLGVVVRESSILHCPTCHRFHYWLAHGPNRPQE